MTKTMMMLVALLFSGVVAMSCNLLDTGDSGSGDALPGDPCGGTVDCTPGSICWNEICVESGALRFSMSWDVATDLDLHVLTPNGNEIYYSNTSADYGELDVDDCIGGSCTTPDGTHVENVYFTDEAMSGTYTYWVYNYDGTETVDFELEVAEDDDVVATQTGTVSPDALTSEQYTYDF